MRFKVTPRRIGATLGAAFVLVQFVPANRANPPVESSGPANAAVRDVLRRSCFDCHSNETRWPWYSRVAPASWLVAHDVHEAREEMNFSTWNRIDAERRAKLIYEIGEEVEEGEMPPWKYTIMHGDARLSSEGKSALLAWAAAEGRPGHDHEVDHDDD